MSYPKDELIAYQRAKEVLQEAEVMAGMNHWETCINRFYYACFYAVTALLEKHDLSSSKHTGVRSLFNSRFIVTNTIPKDYGRLYNFN